MNWDVLLHWMTHLGEGSWEGFKESVACLAPDEEKRNDLIINLRLLLSDMAYADFFIGGSRRWRVFPPILAGLATSPDDAVLCGGRTPRLIGAFAASAKVEGCIISQENAEKGPTTMNIQGDSAALARVASVIGVGFVSNYAATLCCHLVPLYELFEHAPEYSVPTNWSLRSFDFESMSLVDGLRPNSACECTPRRGLPRWFVHQRHGNLRSMPKREAIYAAAMLQEVTLLQYDVASRRLSAPVKAQPPEPYARVACLCAGRRGRVQGDMIMYEEVPPSVAAVLCGAVGQAHPGASLAAPGAFRTAN